MRKKILAAISKTKDGDKAVKMMQPEGICPGVAYRGVLNAWAIATLQMSEADKKQLAATLATKFTNLS